MHKLRAMLIHLGISLLLFLACLYVIVFHWYPGPLFVTDGGWQGLRIMALVDLVLGPTLTFLVFNPAKSRRALAFDFTCIALIQGVALVYGMYNVQSVRPWSVAYYDGALYVTTRETFVDQDVAPGTWERLGDGPVYWVFARDPRTDDESAGVAAFGMLAGVGPEGLAFLYEPMAPHLETMRAAALDMPSVVKADAALAADYADLMRGADAARLRFFPLHGFYASVIVALDERGEIVATLYHEPPPAPAAPAATPEAEPAPATDAPGARPGTEGRRATPPVADASRWTPLG
ncbi:MAG TPA: hypothetical protein VGE57_11415 [Solimonas sp.]